MIVEQLAEIRFAQPAVLARAHFHAHHRRHDAGAADPPRQVGLPEAPLPDQPVDAILQVCFGTLHDFASRASSSSAWRGARCDVAVLVVLVQGLPVMEKNAFYCPGRIIGAEVPMKPPTRRTFLKHAAAGVAGGAIAASGRAGAHSAASQDRVAGANGRIRVALDRLRRPGHRRSAQRPAARRAMRRALRRGRRAGRQGRRAHRQGLQPGAGSRRPRLPPRTRSQGRRRGDRRHARSLARAADDHGVPGGQGRLRRETARVDHRRGPRHGQRRPPHNRVVQMGTQQRSSTHFPTRWTS